MSRKRSVNDENHESGVSPKLPRTNASRSKSNEEVDESFEDPWEDELDSEEDPEGNQGINDAERKNEDDMDVDQPPEDEDETTHQPNRPFILGVDKLEEGYALEADESSYIMRHDLSLDWSCLSFDILVDQLGDGRQRFPTSAYIVAGSKAERSQDNHISVFKLSALHRTQTHDSDSEDDGDDDDALDEDPIVESRLIPQVGGLNRVRAQPLPNRQLPSPMQPYFTAAWSETGKVHIYNVRPFIESLDTPGYTFDRHEGQKPSFTINSHSTEGFAMDWNAPSSSSLSLLTGDNTGRIYLTTAGTAGFGQFDTPFLSHESSVEDLQWSPTEITVFGSCSSDCSIRMWDIRSKARRSVAAISGAHSIDVNVISWNKSTSYLLLSGDDNGQIKVWDLRNIGSPSSHVAEFGWHKSPITSIEWHPSDDSVFAASGDDHQVTMWDLAVEADDDESAKSTTDKDPDLPPQLLFTHYQECVKELHWHPQIPGAVVSAGVNGLSLFKTIAV